MGTNSSQTKDQSKKAPEGASRCQVFAVGISLYLFGSRMAVQLWSRV